MLIEFTKFVQSLSVALDYAEKALLNVYPYHGTRVALISRRLGQYMGIGDKELFALTMAASLHDCALSEYFKDEMLGKEGIAIEKNMAPHCSVGEDILSKIPTYSLVKGAVLYHHDRADGEGAFGLKAEDTPICGQIIHMADVLDVFFDLYIWEEDKYDRIIRWIENSKDIVFAAPLGDAVAKTVDADFLRAISGESCLDLYKTAMPDVKMDVSLEVLRDMSSVFADITDYKSHFTWRHSMGIAEKAEIMGKYYGLSAEETDKLFVAGALHDIGKLITDNDILEKPGRLTPEEYTEIQFHAKGTWDMLHDIGGLEDITHWAAFHHERLDGTGYPFGHTAEELDRNDRLLACLDIYQALVEKRPYKDGMSHEDAMAILFNLADKGQLDADITADVDKCFKHNN